MTTYAADRATDGLSGALLVARGDRTVLRAARGVADAETGEPCTPATRFQIASVSKQFTAVAVLLLAQDGALDPHAPIARYAPGLPAHWQELTLHQLLTHTSGLGHWQQAAPGWDFDRPGTAEELLRRAGRTPLRTAPGTAWHYSSPGYLLAARVVEHVTGLPHARLLAERIFQPLGMTRTLAGSTPRHERAHGFRAGRRVDVPGYARLPGTGDIWSTVDDLARYLRALGSGAILSDRSRAALWTAHARPVGDPAGPLTEDGYGYGLFLGTLAGRAARYHPGDNPGYRSLLVWLPGDATVVVVLANTEESDPDAVLRRVQPVGGGAASTSDRL